MRPLVRGHDELRIRIDRAGDASYRVLASTRSAEASANFELPFNELEIENFILKVSRPRGRRGIATSAIEEARRFGGGLFKALFREQIYGLYHDTLAEARSQQRGVRITLCLSGAPELIDVPWEYLFDHPDFLAVSAFTPVVRYLDLPRGHRPLLMKPPLHLLGVISNPADYEQLDVERERDNLERALSGLISAGAVDLHWLERPTLGGLLKALQTQTIHALHYIGHGSYDSDAEQGILLFEDDSGWSRPVNGDKLGMVLHDFSSLGLVVLNACEGARTARTDPFAGVAGSLVQRDIPAVVAMQFEISDEAAIVFASGFYQPLATGIPVDASLSAARLAMLAERGDDIEWGTPVLFMRVPDGRIFDLSGDPDSNGAEQPAVGADQTGSTRSPANASGSTLNILINYRADDTAGHALLIADRLRQHFGEDSVHFAIDGSSGAGRVPQLESGCAFLPLIGPGWLSSVRTAAMPALAEDSARRELEWALRDMSNAVIPVLIDAAMPDPETLPRSLRGLSRKDAAELRHAFFDQDLAALVSRLQRLADTGAQRSPTGRRPRGLKAEVPAALRPEPSRVAAGIPQPYDDHYVDVIRGMLDGRVVPLLGPGVRGTPSGADDLAAPLAEQFDANPCRLAEVAQWVAVTSGERRLYAALRDLVSAQSIPNSVHRFLADAPAIIRREGLEPRYQLIVSANYDAGLERAFEDANEPFDYVLYLAGSGCFVHIPWGEHASGPIATKILEPRTYVDFPIDDDGELARTIIVKIHGGADGHEGSLAWHNNYVVTEDQYIDYLPTQNVQDHLPIQILDKLTGSRCLFLGYALRDWSARVFLRRIWMGRPISESSWAIEEAPDLLEKASWSLVGHVELLAAPLSEYVNTLRSMLTGRGAAR